MLTKVLQILMKNSLTQVKDKLNEAADVLQVHPVARSSPAAHVGFLVFGSQHYLVINDMQNMVIHIAI